MLKCTTMQRITEIPFVFAGGNTLTKKTESKYAEAELS